ncbi:uncharacterized protein VTP21DRAFT_2823 [Calcarisporiella thermophila]|uniref:uncharacterized protein n=1 Tax=Calcarisporiella thermophila TaxID=911321 RepID=UPI0037426E59
MASATLQFHPLTELPAPRGRRHSNQYDHETLQVRKYDFDRRTSITSLAVRQPQPEWYTQAAIAFDIDGVLLRGGTVLPEAKRALRILDGHNPYKMRIPYVFITNGGGVGEAERAKKLSKQLGVPVSETQVVQSHTPMKGLVEKYKDELVLVVGGEGLACRKVAHDYGFKHVAVPDDIVAWNNTVWPYRKIHPEYEAAAAENSHIKYDFMTRPIAAVLCFHDSRDWGCDMQIVVDVLTSKGGYVGTAQDTDKPTQQVPIYFSNPDIIWSTDFPLPRYGQGAFRLALGALFKWTTGREMEYTQFGKPHAITYEYAKRAMCNHLKDHGVQLAQAPTNVYAIGDNPASDIAGARAANWHGILVKTGIARENDPNIPAHAVLEHVEDAIKYILEREFESGSESDSSSSSF